MPAPGTAARSLEIFKDCRNSAQRAETLRRPARAARQRRRRRPRATRLARRLLPTAGSRPLGRTAKLRDTASDAVVPHAVCRGAGPAVLLLHGLGWDHRLWAATQDRLADQFLTVAVDLRGHGATPATPGGWSVHDLAADCRRLLDRLGLVRCAVVGFSMGGMVAAALAQMLPERITGLVLAGCALHVTPAQTAATEAMLERARALGAEAFAREQAAAIWHPAWRAAHPERVERFVAERAAMDQEALAMAFRCTRGLDLRPGLARLTMPSLVVAADQDPFVDPAEARALAAALPAAELAVLERCGHMLTLEQPERFAQLLDALLARAWPARLRGAA